MEETRTSRRAWLIFGLGVVAYAVAVFQRASLGVAAVEAQRRFGTTAAVLALLSVLQLAVYAALQVPVGVLLDRLGSRRLIAGGATLMGVGQLVLATAHHVGLAVGGRVLVGAGDAMTFIGVLRLIAVWFPPSACPATDPTHRNSWPVRQIVAAYPLVALLQGAGCVRGVGGCCDRGRHVARRAAWRSRLCSRCFASADHHVQAFYRETALSSLTGK